MVGGTLLSLAMLLMVGQNAGKSQPAASPATVSFPHMLRSAEAGPVMPATVFFRGLSAPIQARNSAGVEVAEGRFVLAALVDTAGYSTGVQERYQAYLITEYPIMIDGHKLPPGAYGCGFIAGDKFLLQDLGGHELFTAHTQKDAGMKRPTPLQWMAVPGKAGTYRWYSGRTAVEFTVEPDERP